MEQAVVLADEMKVESDKIVLSIRSKQTIEVSNITKKMSRLKWLKFKKFKTNLKNKKEGQKVEI